MHAVLNLDKPRGITSHEALTRAKRLLGVKKAGHAGTLDPIATGVLLVCLGEATKASRLLMDLGKEYVAVMKFGQRTDTFDADGKVTEVEENFSFGLEEVNRVLKGFRGQIRQRPPMYSAVKISGRPLYKFAREGLEVERPEREVHVYSLEAEELNLPFLGFRVSCSKGTYVRSLVDDIGRALGTFAHMTELRRVRVGEFRAEGSAGLDELPGNGGALFSLDEALSHLTDLVLSGGDFARALNGRPLEAGPYGRFRPGGHLRLKDPEGRLFALGLALGDSIKIDRILHINGVKS